MHLVKALPETPDALVTAFKHARLTAIRAKGAAVHSVFAGSDLVMMVTIYDDILSLQRGLWWEPLLPSHIDELVKGALILKLTIGDRHLALGCLEQLTRHLFDVERVDMVESTLDAPEHYRRTQHVWMISPFPSTRGRAVAFRQIANPLDDLVLRAVELQCIGDVWYTVEVEMMDDGSEKQVLVPAPPPAAWLDCPMNE